MSARLKRAGTVSVLAAAMLCGACDNSQSEADKKVRSELAEARFLSRTTDTPDSAKAMLTTAAENKEASQAARAEAMAARAESELDTAIDLTRKIDQKELELSRVQWGIIELAQQIRSSNSARAGYQKFDPKPIKEQIEAKLAEVRGGPGKPAWFPHASSSVPTLATVTEQVGKLEGELSQKNTEMAGLTSRRTQLIDQAEQAGVQSNSLKGQEALAAFTNASNLRKQAGDVGVQIDGLKSQINRLERQLAVAKGQQTIVNEVITQLQDQMAQVDQAWKKYEEQATAHQELSSRILGTGSSGGPAGAVGGTIAQKAIEVDRLAKEIQQLRADGVAAANNAVDFFSKAYDSASAAQVELRTRADSYANRPEAAVWRSMAAVLNPLQYRLRQAGAQRVLGELYASEAASAASRIDVRNTVQNALEGTGLSVPGPLSGREIDTVRQTALTNAEAAYKNSEELLSNLVDGGGSQDLKAIAHVNRALSFYGWAQVARQAKNETLAKERIAGAKAARDLAFENKAPLPSMPAELGPPPKPLAPETESMAAATTAPADPAADEAAARATLEKFVVAVKAADSDAAKRVSEIEPGAEASFDVIFSIYPKPAKLDELMEQKFGPPPAPAAGQMTFSSKDPLKELPKAKLTITADRAVLAGAAGEPPMPGDIKELVRKNGAWKVSFSAPKTDMDKMGVELLGKLDTGLTEIIAGINSGKYPSRASADEALMVAFMSAMGAPGGPGGTGAPGGPPTTPAPTVPITPDPVQPRAPAPVAPAPAVPAPPARPGDDVDVAPSAVDLAAPKQP